MCAGVDSYTRFCAVLTAYSESDFRSDVTQGASVGVFQQNPRWWPSATQGTAAQCRAFLDDFTGKVAQHTGRPVEDCWRTQRWAAPDPRLDPESFAVALSTINYARRVPLVQAIIDERKIPA